MSWDQAEKMTIVMTGKQVTGEYDVKDVDEKIL